MPRKEREQQMIDVAVGVFAKRGYHAASVDEIAERAGISKPMVYLYLDSKEGLFLACLRREAERLGAAFEDAARSGGRSGRRTGAREAPAPAAALVPAPAPDERLYAGLRAFFTFVAEHRDSWVVLHRQASELSEPIAAAVAEARRGVMAQVAELVWATIEESAGRNVTAAPGEPEADAPAPQLSATDADFVAHALVGAADALTDWMARHPDQDPERISLRLMNMVWVGMGQVLKGESWTPLPPGPPGKPTSP
ncbi:TetR/AcrR family transcriptional regulator [Streptomyces sp. G45]|uniref:TetR/AcrR family transcriptional regulator n=1 Tax=Streptomyces sp. G45 TaxID=3406627 RepID=UPI003C218B18